MKKILQTAARESCDKVYAKFEQQKARLSKNPVSLKEFANFLQDKQTIVEESRVLLASKATVDDMYKLLQSQFDVKIHLSAQGKWEDLHKTSQTFSEFLENADSTVSSRMSQMTQTVKSQITVLDEEATTMYTSMMGGIVLDDQANSDEVLTFLGDKKEALDKMEQERHVLSEYQVLLGLKEHDYANLKTATELFDKKKEVWGKISEWEDTVEDWNNKEWSEHHPEEMDLVIQAQMKDATRLFKVDEDAVCARFKKSVTRWKGFSPTLVALGNDALKERHWKKVSWCVSGWAGGWMGVT